MDDILICAETNSYIELVFKRTIVTIEEAGVQIAKEKIQHTFPWTYLGLQIGGRVVTPQQLSIKDDPKTLRDLHQQCRSINWICPLLGITMEDLAQEVI